MRYPEFYMPDPGMIRGRRPLLCSFFTFIPVRESPASNDPRDRFGVKNMKVKILIIAGLLALVCMVMVAPVMASDAYASTSVSGTVTKVVSLTTSSGAETITLTPGSTTHVSTVTLSASQNCAGTIAAKDALSSSKPSSTAGYMANYSTSSSTFDTAISPATQLTDKVALSGTTSGVYAAAAQITDLSQTSPASTLYTVSGGGSNSALGLDFSQRTEYADSILPNGYVYEIPVEFDYTCS